MGWPAIMKERDSGRPSQRRWGSDLLVGDESQVKTSCRG
jgi:hypothetical protein